jgi:serine/threonine protein kinase
MRVTMEVTAGPSKGRCFAFDDPDCFLFGRAADARVCLPFDKYLSRHHFLIEIAPPSCKVTDLESLNGTYVNNVRYGGTAPLPDGAACAREGTKETHLKNGDSIKVGETAVLVGIDVEVADESTVYTGPLAESRRAIRTLRAKQVPVGQPTIPGYTIQLELGRGGMGVVYQALQESTRRLVAIKTLLPQASTSPEKVRAFEREVELTRQLIHPNIVELLDCGRAEDGAGTVFYFVLEYVEGLDLARFMQTTGGRMPLDHAAPIILGALEGLAYAHTASVKTRIADGTEQTFRGIVHRDIKPQNILLAQGGGPAVPKLADFGLSKSFQSSRMTDMTMPGQLAGTPVYWPREQITHYKYLYPATDVFSMAAVFYEMLTGAHVRDGFGEMFTAARDKGRLPGISDYLYVISNHPVRPIRERNPAVPEPVAAVLDRALREEEIPVGEDTMHARLATLRYPDAGAFRDALAAAFRKTNVLH